ncbi:MAG TPA: pyridoxal phosphate-dependent aminotransferase [Candidatus Paceibacterota bacterium]|nr:pyridoxal phosphate-dependent aminotransferase [Candidatus Paceibacterota bacterium]
MKNRSAIAAAGKKFRTKNISKRVREIVISPIKEMSILADQVATSDGKYGTRNKKIISFGQGIPYFDTPPLIKRAIKKALTETETAKYTLEPGITELRELIARDLARRKGIKNIKPKKEIMVSSGCQEAVACALATVIDPGDHVLLPEPAFASHIEQIIQWGGKPIFVPLDEKNGWRLDVKECEKRLTKRTRAILFSNPSNPTGAVFGKTEMTALAKFAKKHDLIIITDETYDFLTYDGAKHFSPASIPSVRDRVILCGSFSKKYAMTGYRVGFAFADEGLIDHMLKVHDALQICAPAISQKGAIAALKNKQTSVGEFVKKLSKNREIMCRELDKLSGFVEYQKPMGAYYIMVKILKPKIDSFKLALKILREARVITIPGAAFGPSGKEYLRFSFAGAPEEIKEGFRRLNKWFNK